MSESCLNCKFWLKSGDQKNLLGDSLGVGACRRYAPIPLLVPIPQQVESRVQMVGRPTQSQFEMTYNVQQVQPTTPDTHWCGDWQSKKG